MERENKKKKVRQQPNCCDCKNSLFPQRIRRNKDKTKGFWSPKPPPSSLLHGASHRPPLPQQLHSVINGGRRTQELENSRTRELSDWGSGENLQISWWQFLLQTRIEKFTETAVDCKMQPLRLDRYGIQYALFFLVRERVTHDISCPAGALVHLTTQFQVIRNLAEVLSIPLSKPNEKALNGHGTRCQILREPASGRLPM